MIKYEFFLLAGLVLSGKILALKSEALDLSSFSLSLSLSEDSKYFKNSPCQ